MKKYEVFRLSGKRLDNTLARLNVSQRKFLNLIERPPDNF
jgi:hypothetical protein